jgi:GT2 family glycosyltransferase/glycosyltransferase involved in cell wall biosynthesis
MANRNVKFKPEVFRTQLESVKELRKKLARAEEDLAKQEWLLAEFQKSPAWRFTYPARWAVNQFRSIRKLFAPRSIEAKGETPDEFLDEEVSGANSASALTTKSAHDYQFRVWFESFLVSGATLDLPQSSAPRVSILLVLFNRSELTFACLRSIVECGNDDLEVIIVDNASSDDTSKLLDRVCGARIIRNPTNMHFLLAANQAAREAKGENILLLNNDAQLLPGTVASALRTLTSSRDIGAVGGKIIFLDGTLQEAGSIVWNNGSCFGYGRGDDPMEPDYMFRRDVDYCSGAFLMTPRRVWEQLGGFDEAFKPAYYEEADYCMRLWERGLRVVYEPDAAVVHYEFGSSNSTPNIPALQTEHQRIFMERHHEALRKHTPSNASDALKARSRSTADRILFLDDRVPHTWLGSGFPRARRMILSLLKLGFFVSVCPLSEANEPWDVVYSDLPREIEVATGYGALRLESFLRGRRNYYRCIVVSRPHNMEILQTLMLAHPDWFTNIRIVYDAEALFTRRGAMLRKLTGTPWTPREAQDELKKEIELASKAHCVISVSAKEGAEFSQNGIRNIHVIGHAIDAVPQPVEFERRSGLLFVGAIHSEASPNADSMIWFLTEVFPIIQTRLARTVQLTIAGVNESKRIRDLAGPSVHITGYIPNLCEQYARAKVFIAPTRYAAGLPHKIHEAAAYGLPVVATSLLANQLEWTERELAIADDAESFATRCCELYTNPEKWLSQRNAALERVKTDCSPESFDRAMQIVFQSESLK